MANLTSGSIKTEVNVDRLRRRRFGWTTIYVGALALTLLIAFLLHVLIQGQLAAADYETRRASVQKDLDKAALDLSLIFQRNADTIRATSALISIEPDINNRLFSAFAAEIFKDHTDFKRISTARNLIVNNIHPLQENALSVGNNLKANTAFMAHVDRSIENKDVLFVGPDVLYNGDRGIVAIHPVYSQRNQELQSELWGIVSLVIDFEEEIQLAGIDELPFLLSIRGKDSRGEFGDVFWGAQSVFSLDPVYATVDLPIGSWLMAAAPRAGWYEGHEGFESFDYYLLSGTCIVLVLLMFVIRLFQLREKAGAQLSIAIECIDQGFAYYDKDDRLVACNDAYRAIHGASVDQTRPGTDFEAILRSGLKRGRYAHAIGREQEWLKEQMASHRNLPEGVEEQQVADGAWLQVTKSRAPDGGTVVFASDVSELRNAKEEAVRANKAKSEFLDVMSHELRTPLTVVLGGTPFLCKPELLPATNKVFSRIAAEDLDIDALQKDVDGMLASLKGLAGKVERSAKHLLTLINEVLDYSKIEAGRMKLNFDAVYADDIVDGVLAEFKKKADDKGLYLRAKTADHAAWADDLRLRQILNNLTGNALKFTDKGGITVSSEEFGEFIRFKVSDTGCGIAADRVEGIFDKFTQADSSSARRTGGTGLGLAISKKFVEMHGGTMSVKSVEGEGSEFSFTLPKHVVQHTRNVTELRQPAA